MSISRQKAKGEIMRDCLIIGAGSTVKHYKKWIEKFIAKDNLITIGVNNVSHMFKLDYHLWTNKMRLIKYYNENMTNTTPLVLTEDLYVWAVKQGAISAHQSHVLLIDNDIETWRTAGLRAIQFAHDNDNMRNIFCVGFDGYSLVYGGDQHCYSSGMSDLKDMDQKKGYEYEVEKDDLVYSQMRRMESEGVMFEILTPTIFEDFYNGSVL